MDHKHIVIHNRVLRLFIGFVQMKNPSEVEECSKEDCLAVLNWLSSNQIDVNKKDWHIAEDGNLIPQFHNMNENNLVSWIWKLKGMLSILLKCNGNVKFIDENWKTILHVFIEDYLANCEPSEERYSSRNHYIITYLMDKGISVETADTNGNTPVHMAALFKKIHVVELMLPKYSKVNACNNEGDTLLHILCFQIPNNSTPPPEECMQSVLVKGANVNIQNNLGWTPVHFAAKHNYLRILRNFLNAKADLNLLTENGENPLLLACKHALVLHPYSENTSSELVQLLITKGSRVNVIDRDGYSPLHYACKSYRLKQACKMNFGRNCTFTLLVADSVLKPLVKAGANVNAQTADGTTPLHLVTLSQLTDAVEYLIEKGADVTLREIIFGFTALHLATLQHHLSKLECLLSQGLDVNDGGIYGITALHLASFRCNITFMELLIARGADVHCRDRETNSTTLHFVAKDGPVLDYISSICRVGDEPFWNPTKQTLSQSKDAVQLLVDRGVDVNAKDTCGRTPLHVATTYAVKEQNHGHLQQIPVDDSDDQIRALLNNEAHMDIIDHEGHLPIHNALLTGHKEALRSLMDFGVNINETDTCQIAMNCNENMKTLMNEYLVKLRVANLPISDGYIFDVGNTTALENEVKQMKSYFLNVNTSLYNVIHLGWRQLSNLAPRLPDNLKERFPLYAGIIRARCRDAEQRRSLIEAIKSRWHTISEIVLPEIIVDYILELLYMRNLRVLLEALL